MQPMKPCWRHCESEFDMSSEQDDKDSAVNQTAESQVSLNEEAPTTDSTAAVKPEQDQDLSREEENPPASTSKPSRKTLILVLLLALLALLLGAAGLGLSGWMYYSNMVGGQERETSLQTQMDELKSQAATASGRLQQERKSLELSLQQDVADLKASQVGELESLKKLLQQQRRRLLELGTTDRSDWMLAEVEYLLRLANQRLVMTRDVNSALALLNSADGIIRELDDATLYTLREAIAADAAALRAAPRVDVEGSWLRIQALVGEVDRLLLFELPDLQPAEEPLVPDAGLVDKLQHGIRAALAHFSSYIVIRRRDEPYQALLDPQWEGLVRQNLRMLLEQSRSALLNGNQKLYQQSLANTRRWLGEFFSFNEAAVTALDSELESLEGLQISPELPDITASLAAARLAIDEKHSVRTGGQ